MLAPPPRNLEASSSDGGGGPAGFAAAASLPEDRLLWEFWLNHGTDAQALRERLRDLPSGANGAYVVSNALYGGFEGKLGRLLERERGRIPAASDLPSAWRAFIDGAAPRATPGSPEGRLLVLLALRPDPAEPAMQAAAAAARRVVSWKAFLRATCRSNLVTAVAPRANAAPLVDIVPSAEREMLARAAEGILARNRRLLALLRTLLDRFASAGLTPVLLKESALLLDVYPSEADRMIGDLDLLFSGAEVDDAERTLIEAGYTPFEGIWSRAWYRSHHHHLAPLVSAEQAVKIEPHTGIWIPRSSSASIVPEMIAASSPHPALRAGRPAPEHLLFHMLVDIHGNVSIGKLGQLADIAALLRAAGPRMDTGRVTDLARRTGSLPFVRDSLELLRRLYGGEFIASGAPGLAEILAQRRPTLERRLICRMAYANLCGFEPTGKVLSVASDRLLHKALLKPGSRLSRAGFVVKSLLRGQEDESSGPVTRSGRASAPRRLARLAAFPFRAVSRLLRTGRP